MFLEDKQLVTNLQSSLLYVYTDFCYSIIAMGTTYFNEIPRVRLK